jgi:hypothetical protein
MVGMNPLAEYDRGWVTALFEGEGTMYASYPGARSFSVSLNSTDEDVVRRLHDLVGIGNVYGPYEKSNGRKQQWAWVAQGTAARDFLVYLRDGFCERRRARADAMLVWRAAYESVRLAPRKCEGCDEIVTPASIRAGARKLFCSPSCQRRSLYQRRKVQAAH